ncbi:MAG: sodium:solute symporter family protein [Planctomycetota bacterium]|nr:sodium:solute symporter family protein [Planctomycetota bacterium]
MDLKSWTLLFVGCTFTLYLFIAWRSRVRDTSGFYVAGRGVPAAANGMATAADWMSAASFLSMAGLISIMGYSGCVYLMGWTGGYVLLALLLAPYLRKSGNYTVPDFVGDRYDSNVARMVAVVCAIFVSFTYVAGQMRGVGIVFSRFLEVDINVGVLIGMAIVFVYATLGGMKGITWTQVAQYWVIITAFLIPAVAISIKLTGHAMPQIGMGSELLGGTATLLDKLDQIQSDLGFGSYTEPFIGAMWDKTNVFCTALALMAGTAGLPHVIVRFYTVKNVRAARWSAFWALLFISILYLTAPATAAFARYYMIDSLDGKSAQELPGWFEGWEKTNLIIWLDDGDGRVQYRGANPKDGRENEIFRRGKLEGAEVAAIREGHNEWLASGGPENSPAAQGADGRAVLRDLKLSGPDRDIIVLASPEMAELSTWIIALVAAGGLAAALSTASGLLLVISSSVAHDVYYKVVNPQATERQRLRVGRIVIGFAVVIAGLFGIFPPGFVSQVVAFAFGLAAASFFPALVLGIFSRRVGTVPAVAGMICGIGFTASYIIGSVYGGMDAWCFGIGAQGIGVVGMVINFAVTISLMPFCPAPPARVQALLDDIRSPEAEDA